MTAAALVLTLVPAVAAGPASASVAPARAAADARAGVVRPSPVPTAPGGVPRKPLVRLKRDAAADQCFGDPVAAVADDPESPGKSDAEQAALLMQGKLQLGDFPAWDLPADPTWAEDPFGDANWVQRYQRLTWVDVLRREGQRTGNQAMLDRYNFLLRDWAKDNPVSAPASPWAWFRIDVAERAIVYLCKLGRVGTEDYLPQLLVDHALYLAAPANYPGKGNHALWMDQGLIAIGCATSVPDYSALGVSRLNTLVSRSIDEQGVTDEGSVSYQKLNWDWYTDAKDRVDVCGLPEPADFARIALMPEMVAYATMPDGLPAMIGDTVLDPMNGLKGTIAEYPRTRGASGTPPPSVYKTYQRGYTFGRSGWGDATRAATDEAAFWLKFGQPPADQVHGHEDLGSIELAAYGSRLIWDSGLYAYLGGTTRKYMVERAGHNVIDVPGAKYQKDKPATLRAEAHYPNSDMVAVQSDNIVGTRWQRRLLFSRGGGWILIDDRVDQDVYRPVVQRWNFGPGKTVSTPLWGGRTITSGPGANVVVVQLGDRGTRRTYEGQETPRYLGWRSPTYRKLEKAPTVETILPGKQVRFLTLIAPLRAGSPDDVTVSELQVLPNAVSLVVTSQGVSERLYLDGSTGFALPYTAGAPLPVPDTAPLPNDGVPTPTPTTPVTPPTDPAATPPAAPSAPVVPGQPTTAPTVAPVVATP